MKYNHKELFDGLAPVYTSECKRFEIYEDGCLFDVFDTKQNRIIGCGDNKNRAYRKLSTAIDAVESLLS